MDQILIAPIKREELEIVNQYLPKKIFAYHLNKLEDQEKGHSLWLILWKDGVPAAHAQLVWAGSLRENVQEHVHQTPQLNSLYVEPAYRSQGLATKLIKRIEHLAADRGYHKLGLSVDIRNKPALNLYAKLGFRDWERGSFDASWTYITTDGQTCREEERCTYMIKTL
jgi:GNAT superfamily N-acetyltransferase